MGGRCPSTLPLPATACHRLGTRAPMLLSVLSSPGKVTVSPLARPALAGAVQHARPADLQHVRAADVFSAATQPPRIPLKIHRRLRSLGPRAAAAWRRCSGRASTRARRGTRGRARRCAARLRAPRCTVCFETVSKPFPNGFDATRQERAVLHRAIPLKARSNSTLESSCTEGTSFL